MTTFKGFDPTTGQPVSNQGFWIAEVGKRPRYARKSDAEAYEAGWRKQSAPNGDLRGAYLQGLWDREDADKAALPTDTEGGDLD